jgi:hypothetical protein
MCTNDEIRSPVVRDTKRVFGERLVPPTLLVTMMLLMTCQRTPRVVDAHDETTDNDRKTTRTHTHAHSYLALGASAVSTATTTVADD